MIVVNTAQRSLSIALAFVIVTGHLTSLAHGQLGGVAAPSPPKDHVSALAFAADGSLLAGAGLDKIRIWEMKHSQFVRAVTTGGPDVTDIGFSSHAKLLAAGCDDGMVRLWSSETGEPAKTLAAGDDATYFVAFSPDGRLLASTHRRSPARAEGARATAQLHLWDVTRGEVERTLIEGDADFVASPVFSADGQQLAAAIIRLADTRYRTEIYLWNVKTQTPARTLPLAQALVKSLAFFPDARSLVTVARRFGGGCSVVEMARWDSLRENAAWWIEDVHSDFHDVAVSPDGLSIASAGRGPWMSSRWRDSRPITSGCEIVLRAADTGRALARAEGEGSGRTAVAFSPDGRLLATCDDRQVALRDAKTLAVQQVLWPFPGTP